MNRPGVAYKAMAGPGELQGVTLDGVGASGVASVRAVVATLGKVDADGDLTVPGFFGRQNVQVVPAHDWQHIPIGKGQVFEQGDQAIAELKVNLAIPQARAWYEAFRFDLEHPPALQQWSYGYTVKAGGSFEGRFGGKRVRFLQPLGEGSPGVAEHEVSPVLQGAGVDTATLQVGEPAGVDDGELASLRAIARQFDPGPDMAREYARFVRGTLEAA
jgi:hypothetical protein